MSYAAAGRRIKSEFVVRPGADPAQIRLVYQGANRISVGAGGDLIVSVRRSELREEAPEIYQDLDRGRVHLNGRYRLLGPRTVVRKQLAENTHADPTIIPKPSKPPDK